MSAKYLAKVTLAVVAVYLASMAVLGARAATTQRYDHFRSRNSGNVVLVPNRCWQEDSLAHLYMTDYDGARLVLHCHHKGY